MAEFKLPTEEVELPSKGLLYSKDNPLSSGKLEMKYMTAKEEDILTNQNFISKGVVIDKLLQSLIVNKDINYNTLLIGDKNAIMIAARILSYGKSYEFTYDSKPQNVDLSLLQNKEIDADLFKSGENNFGFTLPEWANTEEKYVTIESIGEVQISSIGYSDTYESFILEFDIAYSGSPVERKISALYDLNPYEVYEFSTDMSTTPDSFNLVIECGVDANNINFSYISETIKIVEDENFLLRLDYWSDENKGGMVYQTGIKNKIRLKGKMKYVGDQKTEGYDGDKEYFITDNVVYNSYELTIPRLTSAMAHKMRLISGHSELYINGIKSKLAEEPEVSGDENNNFKTFKAVFKQSGNEFLTDAQQQIINTPENNALTAAILAAQGKSFLLWTKN